MVEVRLQAWSEHFEGPRHASYTKAQLDRAWIDIRWSSKTSNFFVGVHVATERFGQQQPVSISSKAFA